MMTLFRLRGGVNSCVWRGFPPGTVMLARGKGGEAYDQLTAGFDVRDDGFQLTDMEGTTHKIRREVDFKYALRSLHRRGFRNVRLKFCRDDRVKSFATFHN